ncbi:hypothetical protein FACS1894202_05300 [Clostridia bacterium]|nr:hypothetical protein FACS1894202_05300 [Clostridia bacterium]
MDTTGHNYGKFDERRRVREAAAADRAPRAAEKSAARVRRKHTLPLVPTILFIYVMLLLFGLVWLQADLSGKTRSIAAAKKQVEALQTENKVLTAKMESRMDIQRVSEWANDFGMNKPDRRQYIYINMSGEETAEVLKRRTILDEAADFIKNPVAYLK